MIDSFALIASKAYSRMVYDLLCRGCSSPLPKRDVCQILGEASQAWCLSLGRFA